MCFKIKLEFLSIAYNCKVYLQTYVVCELCARKHLSFAESNRFQASVDRFKCVSNIKVLFVNQPAITLIVILRRINVLTVSFLVPLD